MSEPPAETLREELADAVPETDRGRRSPEDGPTRPRRDDDFGDARDEERRYVEGGSGGTAG